MNWAELFNETFIASLELIVILSFDMKHFTIKAHFLFEVVDTLDLFNLLSGSVHPLHHRSIRHLLSYAPVEESG